MLCVGTASAALTISPTVVGGDIAAIYTNTGVVTGTPLLAARQCAPSGLDLDRSVALSGGDARYRRVEVTNGYDADDLNDLRALLKTGDPVTWTFIIRNTGNIVLTPTLTDDRLGVLIDEFGVPQTGIGASSRRVLALGADLPLLDAGRIDLHGSRLCAAG